MILLSPFNLYVAQKSKKIKFIYYLSSDDKINEIIINEKSLRGLV